MSDLLYLDTARLGRMSPGAAAAARDFVALAGDEGGGLYFDRFLAGGLGACPAPFGARYPGLAGWQGVGSLKAALRSVAGVGADHPLLLAGRTAVLMRFAARFLFHPCRNVLATDLDWPPYAAVLDAEARAAGRIVTRVPVRDDALAGRLCADQLADVLCDRFARAGCDGLYLTAVSNLGVRTPVVGIVARLEAGHALRAVVVDGAQELGHVHPSAAAHCDVYLAGCHKWLGGHHPLGVAFYGRPRSRGRVQTILAELVAAGELDDPLLRLSSRPDEVAWGLVPETLSLCPLFAAYGAVTDVLPASPFLEPRLKNHRAAVEAVAAAGWDTLLPSPDLRSGILLTRALRRGSSDRDPDALRADLRGAGIAATVYGGGVVRLSMPDSAWRPGELHHLGQSLSRVA